MKKEGNMIAIAIVIVIWLFIIGIVLDLVYKLYICMYCLEIVFV